MHIVTISDSIKLLDTEPHQAGSITPEVKVFYVCFSQSRGMPDCDTVVRSCVHEGAGDKPGQPRQPVRVRVRTPPPLLNTHTSPHTPVDPLTAITTHHARGSGIVSPLTRSAAKQYQHPTSTYPAQELGSCTPPAAAAWMGAPTGASHLLQLPARLCGSPSSCAE
jgi:hypothetical protein